MMDKIHELLNTVSKDSGNGIFGLLSETIKQQEETVVKQTQNTSNLVDAINQLKDVIKNLADMLGKVKDDQR